MVRNVFIAILIVALLIVGVVAYYENQQATQSRQEALTAMKEKDDANAQMQQAKQIADGLQKQIEQSKTMTITLAEENKSGESGTATLKEENGKVTVAISLTGFPKDTPQPAHIHVGDCPGVGKVKYPLTNVVNGTSTTTLDVTLDQLKSQLPLALNVHKSASQIGVYTACGSLGGSTANTSVSPTTTVTQTPTQSESPTAFPTK